MTTDWQIPRKMDRYLKRLASEYRKDGDTPLADVLVGSKFQINEETIYDGWDGGIYGHDLVLMVPDELMKHIPLDEQHEIERRLIEDLNKAASSAQGEFVNDVHFEYLEEEAPNAGELRSLSDPSLPSNVDDRIWIPNTIRLFISHRDTWKKEAHQLADELKRYGISSFVAHDTIEPDEDWQKEIEQALRTMHVMLAFITDDFFESAWTNQEIGFALASNVPVMSIKIEGTDPVGFVRNRQAIKGSPDKMSENAANVFGIVEKRLESSVIFRSTMLTRFMDAGSFAQAEAAFLPVSRMQDFSGEEIERLIDAYNTNSQLSDCWALTRRNRYLNFLNEHSSSKLVLRNSKIMIAKDDEIPF